MNDQELEAQRAIWESMTPDELELEYTRVFGEASQTTAAKGDLIQRLIAEYRQLK
jgi:hypothetical protein